MGASQTKSTQLLAPCLYTYIKRTKTHVSKYTFLSIIVTLTHLRVLLGVFILVQPLEIFNRALFVGQLVGGML